MGRGRFVFEPGGGWRRSLGGGMGLLQGRAETNPLPSQPTRSRCSQPTRFRTCLTKCVLTAVISSDLFSSLALGSLKSDRYFWSEAVCRPERMALRRVVVHGGEGRAGVQLHGRGGVWGSMVACCMHGAPVTTGRRPCGLLQRRGRGVSAEALLPRARMLACSDRRARPLTSILLRSARSAAVAGAGLEEDADFLGLAGLCGSVRGGVRESGGRARFGGRGAAGAAAGGQR
jgi:hypothetical protein